MKKVEFDKIKKKIVKIISNNDYTAVYLLNDSRYFKSFNPLIFNLLAQNGSDVKKKDIEC